MWYSRGLALPPRGSPRDRLLHELHVREVDAEMSRASLELSIMTAASNADGKKVSPLITSVLSKLSQDAYTSKHIRSMLTEKIQDLRRLRAVDELS